MAAGRRGLPELTTGLKLEIDGACNGTVDSHAGRRAVVDANCFDCAMVALNTTENRDCLSRYRNKAQRGIAMRNYPMLVISLRNPDCDPPVGWHDHSALAIVVLDLEVERSVLVVGP